MLPVLALLVLNFPEQHIEVIIVLQMVDENTGVLSGLMCLQNFYTQLSVSKNTLIFLVMGVLER